MSRLTATIKRADSEQPIGPAEPSDRIGQNIEFSSAMPGGDQTCTVTLARDPALTNLDPYDELIIYDEGHFEVWRGYGVEYPASDEDGPEIQISATGWSGYLKDNTPGPIVAVDRQTDHFGELPADRRATLINANWVLDSAYIASSNGSLELRGDERNVIGANQHGMIDYLSPVPLAAVDYKGTAKNTTGRGRWNGLGMYLTTYGTALGTPAITLDNTVRTVTCPAGTRVVSWGVDASSEHTPAAGTAFYATISSIAIYGDHGIPLLTTDTGDGMRGVLASDIIRWGLTRSCPLLDIDITPSTFVIPHFREDEIPSMDDLIQKANGVEMFDWGVFGRTFIYRPAGSGQTWVTNAADPGVHLTDAGPQAENCYSRCVVRYQNAAGQTVSVGYPESGCDIETDRLIRREPLLEAAGRERTLTLSLSATTIGEHAIRVGETALGEYAKANLRGDATLTGTVTTLEGVVTNVCRIKAGDQLVFADKSAQPRQIIEATYSEETDACQVSLDSTPSKLDALLERLAAVNESTGI